MKQKVQEHFAKLACTVNTARVKQSEAITQCVTSPLLIWIKRKENRNKRPFSNGVALYSLDLCSHTQNAHNVCNTQTLMRS